MARTSQDQAAFVLAAEVAAELSSTRALARQIALGAKNAKVVAVRAGDKARGFQPITEFIDDMASQINRLAQDIDREALLLSRAAVHQAQRRDALARFQRAVARAGETLDKAQASARVFDDLDQAISAFTHEIHEHLRILNDHLQQVNKTTRAAKVIATNSRVEACGADEYSQNLQAVADDLEKGAIAIQDKVSHCEQRLAAHMDTARSSGHAS